MDFFNFTSHSAYNFQSALDNINIEHFIDFPISSLGILPPPPEEIMYEGAIYSTIEELPKTLKIYINDKDESSSLYINAITKIATRAVEIAQLQGVECFSLNLNYKSISHNFWHSDFYKDNKKNPEYFLYYLLFPLKGPGTLFCNLAPEDVISFNLDHHAIQADLIRNKCLDNPSLTYQAPATSGAIFNVGDNYAPIHSAPETKDRFFLALLLRKLR